MAGSIWWPHVAEPNGFRNAESAGKVVLKRGRVRQTFLIHRLADADKPRILKSYLDRFHREVQRYFPVQAGSDEQAFVVIAPNYPAFELTAA